MAKDVRTISWTGSSVRVIDQTQLPRRLTYLDIDDVDGLVQRSSDWSFVGRRRSGQPGRSVWWWRCARGNETAGARRVSLWR